MSRITQLVDALFFVSEVCSFRRSTYADSDHCSQDDSALGSRLVRLLGWRHDRRCGGLRRYNDDDSQRGLMLYSPHSDRDLSFENPRKDPSWVRGLGGSKDVELEEHNALPQTKPVVFHIDLAGISAFFFLSSRTDLARLVFELRHLLRFASFSP